jgi:hypothetical protein
VGFKLFGVLPGDNDCGELNRMEITIGIVRVGVSDSKRRVDLGICIDAFPFSYVLVRENCGMAGFSFYVSFLLFHLRFKFG